MTIAIYPGSFDPITNGHIDIIQKSSKIFDKVIVAITYNQQKKHFLDLETRLNLIKENTSKYPNVEVCSYEGLTVDFAKTKGANVIIRGLRNSVDYEYEKQLAELNSNINSDIQTMFMLSTPEHSCISSSAIKELLAYKSDVSKYLPENVYQFFKSNK